MTSSTTKQDSPKSIKANARKPHELATKVQAFVMVQLGIPKGRIAERTGIPERTLHYIQQKVKERGYDPQVNEKLLDCYFKEGKRTGRPRKNKKPEEAASATTPTGHINDGHASRSDHGSLSEPDLA